MLGLTVADILKKNPVNEKVVAKGWLKTKRISKKFAFIVINDGSSFQNLQAIIDADKEGFSQLEQIQTGASLVLEGTWVASMGKGQSGELRVEKIAVEGKSSEAYLLQKKEHSYEFLREIAHFRPRTTTLSAVFRIRNTLANAVHQFFQERGFLWTHTPIITANDCEGAGELFHINASSSKTGGGESPENQNIKDSFFGKPAHLTVSGQLHAEVFAMSHGRVYTFGPTFRAENSNTSRHLSEFWMIEPEMAFADLQDDIELAEGLLKYLISMAVENHAEELEFLAKKNQTLSLEDLSKIVDSEFKTITYTEAVQELQKHKDHFEHPVEWGLDLQTEHERFLTEKVFQCPTVVKDYPKDIKAFYMRLNDDDKTVAAMDILVPHVGEIVGGSQREERLDVLESRLQELNISADLLDWYLDLRRYGTVKHAGFGLGFERIVQYITGMANIRETIPFPRAPKTLDY